MAASRLIILGVAVAAAGGAGYVAKNMAALAPPEVVVNPGPQAPAIALQDVLVLSGDVPMGEMLGRNIAWQAWPSDGINANFITRATAPDALEKLKDSVARMPMYAGEPLRRSKLVGEGQSFMSSILPSGSRAVATSIAADTSAGGFILPNDFVDVIMTRRMSATETPESLILYSALAPVLLLMPTLPFSVSVPADPWLWTVLLLLGVFGGIGHWLLIQAYRRATTTALAPYPYLQMVWMIGAGWLVFHQFPDRWTLVGAAIIVASGLYIIHREHRLRVRNRAALAAETDALAKKL